jgi:hypothetical protein
VRLLCAADGGGVAALEPAEGDDAIVLPDGPTALATPIRAVTS